MPKFGSRGSAILLVLLVLLILVILGMTLSNMDKVQMKILSTDKVYQASYYYAEAGLTQHIEILRMNMEQLYKDPRTDGRDALLAGLIRVPATTPEFSDYGGEKVKLKVTCIKNKAVIHRDELIIMSICDIGKISCSVKAIVEVRWMDPLDPNFRLDDTSLSIVGWEEIR
ncbi:MAG TPA: PilX N-terminal domain-containing pilus assembly protein [Clostridia bacterium]|nr:PilX N-terminal domain-containing pilus assembly protein [Clostridia bacterium]